MESITLKSNYSLLNVENLNNVSAKSIANAVRCEESFVQAITKLHGIELGSNDEFEGHQIAQFILSACGNLPSWVVSICDGRVKRSRLRLKYYRALCLYLVEESNYLMDLTEDERTRCREEISNVLSTVDDYLKAEKLFEPGYFCNPESYIEKIMTKMQKTGYIHKVEETFRIMIAVFRIMPNLMNSKMSQLMDILLMGNINDWKEEELRVQLMKLLDHYITNNRAVVDSMADFESKQDYDLLTTMTRALAMQLYLYEPTDNIDYALNRAGLYRYASHTKIAGNGISTLLDKSYACLVGSIDSKTRLEYSWENIHNTDMLVSMLMNSKTERKNVDDVEFVTSASTISFSSKRVDISENVSGNKQLKTVAPGIVAWHGLKLNLASELNDKVSVMTNDVEKLQRWWVDVERTLTQTKIKKEKKSDKRRAYIDENVDIVIDGVEDPDKGLFRCHIKSDKLEGRGTIAVYDIVNYKVRPEAMIDISRLAFVTSSTGRQALYEASVLTDNGTSMTFSMKKRLNEYLLDDESLGYGYETKCVITSLNAAGQVCIGVSSDGIPVILPYEESILVGDCYDVKVIQVKNNKLGIQLYCEKTAVIKTEVTQDKAFIQLMQDYGIEDESVEELIEQPKKRQMSVVYVQELIRLLDRESLLQKDVHKRYNYLYAAKLLAHIINDDDLDTYYQNRLKLQKLLYEFSKNSKIDRSVLQQLETMEASIKMHYPILNARIKELYILECLDNAEANGQLFAELQNEKNSEVKKLTNLVLAYNHLAGFGLQEQRRSIIEQINELLNVKLEMPDAQYFGEEDDQTEFKSSVVYLANAEGKHIADIEAQTNVILKEICAFLNTKGGTLYIGVNDYGYAQGLDTDMQWFEQHKKWHVTNIDEYRQHVVNLLCRKWPNLKDVFDVTFPKIKGRSVVKISVPPCKTPVDLDGIYYSRVGSECRRITDEGLNGFLERRPMQYEQYVSKLK